MFESEYAAEQIARIERQVREAQENAQAAQQMQASIESLRGEATSSRRTVRVVVDAGGRLQNLQFLPAAEQYPHSELANDVLEAISAATVRNAEQVRQIASETFGENSAVTDRIMKAYAHVHPETETSQSETSTRGFSFGNIPGQKS